MRKYKKNSEIGRKYGKKRKESARFRSTNCTERQEESWMV
jgi:hypothetical protein